MPKLSAKDELLRQEKMKETEKRLAKEGYKYIAGIDEAGRGPLAGPVYAAAVILPPDIRLDGINDSKKLSPKKREELFDEITKKAVSYSIFAVDEKKIDEINILNATYVAMNGAAEALSQKPDYVIIDGNSIKNMSYPHETIVKGDAKSISIAAASVLAKVARDRYITEMAKTYPEYGFERHKGYGTKEHTDAILKYGITPIHRRTFLKKLLEGGK
ncbi:MAG: ribonuclease HII [Clostridia bacterium]|nr:ribonuclease HII [Clostridia bacterium]